MEPKLKAKVNGLTVTCARSLTFPPVHEETGCFTGQAELKGPRSLVC